MLLFMNGDHAVMMIQEVQVEVALVALLAEEVMEVMAGVNSKKKATQLLKNRVLIKI
jgi:hypothetical protein